MINIKFIIYFFTLILSIPAANAYIMVGRNNISANDTGDFTITYEGSGLQQLMVNESRTLAPAGFSFRFGPTSSTGSGVAGYGAGLWCKKSGGSDDIKFTPQTKYGTSGSTYGGHTLFNTNISGLYYTLEMRNFKGTGGAADTTFSPSNFFIERNGTVTNGSLQGNGKCNITGNTYLGGFNIEMLMTFYVDSYFSNAENAGKPLFPEQTAQFRFEATDGSGSYADVRTFSTATMSAPTCFATNTSGEHAQGNTIKLGDDYYPATLENNAAPPVPFSINLNNCMGVNKVDVRLTTNATGENNRQLLGNQYPTSLKAKGVGVLIEGVKNSGGQSVVLVPNDQTSVFQETVELSSDAHKYYPSCIPGSHYCDEGTNKALNFTATLKQDGEIPVQPGVYQGKGVFSLTYN
nr:fimbrial protein [uncultured Enterobacter sp.]